MGNNGFFSIESPLYKFMSRLTDMIKLNFLWVLCSLPIITMGAATTAAFTITLRMVEEKEGYIARPFFREFKNNLVKGSITGIIQLVAMYAIYLDFQLSKIEGNGTIFTVVGVIATFLAFMHLIYAYALLARYENTVINTLRNSYSIGLRYLPKTFGLFLMIVLEYIVFRWNFTTLLIGILLGPACIILTISGFARPLFRLVENDNEEKAAQKEEQEKEYESDMLEDEEFEDTDKDTLSEEDFN
ncbi:MAG: YesL family protein [Lachnospiraceae bacterium]|nr:YesL family protein [Lachnospiraceae bacterium]